jgi:hypothetical protein
LREEGALPARQTAKAASLPQRAVGTTERTYQWVDMQRL